MSDRKKSDDKSTTTSASRRRKRSALASKPSTQRPTAAPSRRSAAPPLRRPARQTSITESLSQVVSTSLLERANVALFIGVDGKIMYCNAYACELLGYSSPKALFGASILKMVPAQYRARLQKQIQQKRAHKDNTQIEFEMIGKDGRLVWLEAVSQPMSFEKKKAVLLLGMNISTRKQLEDALRTSEYKYRSLLENAKEAIVVLQDGKIKFFNTRTVEMIGRRERELNTKPFPDFIHPDDRAMVVQRHRQRLQGLPVPDSYTFRILHGSGEARWVEINVAEMVWENRKATLNFLNDVTERRAAEVELENKMRQLSWISNSASTLLRIETKREIFEFLKGVVAELSGADYLVFSEYDPVQHAIIPSYHFGLEPFLEQARVLTGIEFGRFFHRIEDLNDQMDDMLKMEIHPVPRGFYTLLNKKRPLALCRTIEKLLGIEKIYSRGFVWKGSLFGGIMLAYKKGNALKNQSILEPIINQAALALGRRMYDESLMHSEENYRMLIDSQGEGVGTFDLNEVFTFSNPAAEMIFGVPAGKLVGRSLTEFLDEKDGSLVRAETAKKSKGEKSKYDIVITRPDGQSRTLLVTSSALADAKGLLTGVFAVFHDITDRKLAEQALRRKSHEDAALASISAAMLTPDATLDKVSEQILVHARSLTGSLHGFVSFIDQENGDNIVQTCTNMFSKRAAASARSGMVISRAVGGQYPGLLGHALNSRSAFVSNLPVSESSPAAWPEDFIRLRNLLTVPVQFGDQLLGQIVLLNNEGGYSAQHIDVIKRIAELYAMFLLQKKMLQVIEENEQRYSTFVNSNLDMVFLKDADFRYAVINSRLADFFGKRLEQVIGRTDYELMGGAAADGCRYSDEEALRCGSVFIHEEAIRDRYYETRKFPVTIKNKKVVGGIIRDVTAQKKAQEEILKLSKAIEQSPASVVITDTKGDIEYVNAKFCTVTGYSPQEAIGKNPRILKSGVEGITDYVALWDTVLAGEEWRGEFYNKKKNGELYWESASISPIKNEAGHIIHFIAVKEDITESKRLQKELIAAKDKAEESDRLKSAFLKNISHEIRTPLNGIMGFTELLLDPNNSDDERLQFSYHITLSVNRLIKTVTDIINIATIETGQEVLREKETDLMHLMENVFDELQRTADSKIQVMLQADLQSTEYMILVDETKLSQILSNLTENAVKFTYSGEIQLGCRRQGDELLFFVTDTGIGIPAEHHATIFERFRQVDDSLSRQHEGTGLGLSICQSYVKMMGGKMWVESEQGSGSSFYFTIRYKPAHGFTPRTAEAQQTVAPPPIKTEKTVLIVEDGEIGFALAREYLSGRNLEIMHAVNGREAVDLCLSHPEIDVVLMDIKMPVMDGFEATKLIKAERPDLPIIAQTAYALVGDRDKALNEGCDDYLAKPFKKDELLAKIAHYL